MSTHLCAKTHNNTATRAKHSWWWARLWAAHRTEAGRRWTLTCRWWRGLRGFRFGFHNSFCHNTDCNVRREEQTGEKRYEGISKQLACVFRLPVQFYSSDTLSPSFLVNHWGVWRSFWLRPAELVADAGGGVNTEPDAVAEGGKTACFWCLS